MPNNPAEPRVYRPLPPPPVPLPEPALQEQEEREEGWNWIGSSSRPEAQEGDGISDLFSVPDDPDTSDLITVDIARDILDADEDGDLGSLVDVTEEDVLGDELGQTDMDAANKTLNDINQRPVYRRSTGRTLSGRSIRIVPPTSMRGVQ